MIVGRPYVRRMSQHIAPLPLDTAAAYRALAARDRRFDGLFFVGITSTGIYCRPICPARTPNRANCRFFTSHEAAEKQGFRPCLRCRPELAPGAAPVDFAQRTARLLAQRIEEGLADDGARMEEIAMQFHMSSRQLRRIVQKELGVAPIELMQTRRLLLAKQLLTETHLTVTEIAFASGFSSLRRFNDAFLRRYRMAPSRLRRASGGSDLSDAASGGTSVLQLAYRPPFDWDALLDFLGRRAIAGVEAVADDAYLRTVRIGVHTGWIAVRHLPEKLALGVEFSHSLAPALPALLGRVRQLFDLDARPDLIDGQLGADPALGAWVRAHPGQRVPGAFDPFELAVRAILGQQVTVKAASTLAGRFAAAFGETLTTSHAALSLLTPAAATIAKAQPARIARLGIVGARARSLVALARALDGTALQLEPGADPVATVAALESLPGVGPWTAQYIAMRALRWPDAFPRGDAALLAVLGVGERAAQTLSVNWRPWRSYAVMHLWRQGARR